MSLYWYACISMNTFFYEIYHISLETVQWVLSNASLIMQICPAIHEILADKAFTVTDGMIFQLFVIAFVHPAYVQIALIQGFPVQHSLWKLVYWLWRYKLNEVCDKCLRFVGRKKKRLWTSVIFETQVLAKWQVPLQVICTVVAPI